MAEPNPPPSPGRTVLSYADKSVTNKTPVEPACARSAGWGFASLLLPFLAIVAMVYAIVGLRRIQRVQQRGRVHAWLGITAAVAAVMGWILFLLALNYARLMANQVYCQSELRAVGQALMLYANDHQGELPDSWSTLIASMYISADCFCCPASDRPLPGPAYSALAAYQQGEFSYIYLGSGLKLSSIPPTTILAYELEPRHKGRHHALFADGSVDLLDEAALMKQLQTQLASPPATAPATRPAPPIAR